MSDVLLDRLTKYRSDNNIASKGKLAIIAHLSRVAKERGLPLDPADLVTENKGQVVGLGKAAVQKVLADYGIIRVLAEEGGRTSRGSIGLMRNYVSFLNELYREEIADMNVIEKWWVDRVTDFFNSKPFILRYDTSKTIRAIVRDLLFQAEERQRENPGTTYVGTVLQHLVAAKLSIILPEGIELHGASVSDEQTARNGDFNVDETVIHCTTAPGESLIQKCRRNIEGGYRPIIITTYNRLIVAESLSMDNGLDGRVEIWDIEQFIATNIYELSRFKATERKITVEKIVEAYNKVIAQCETDPSLRIEIN
jgi:hypothetical protein